MLSLGPPLEHLDPTVIGIILKFVNFMNTYYVFRLFDNWGHRFRSVQLRHVADCMSISFTSDYFQVLAFQKQSMYAYNMAVYSISINVEVR